MRNLSAVIPGRHKVASPESMNTADGSILRRRKSEPSPGESHGLGFDGVVDIGIAGLATGCDGCIPDFNVKLAVERLEGRLQAIETRGMIKPEQAIHLFAVPTEPAR